MFPEKMVGKKEVYNYWKNVPGMFHSLSFPIHEIYSDETGNIITIRFDSHNIMKDRKGRYDNTYVCIFKFDERGKIKQYYEYFNPITTGVTYGMLRVERIAKSQDEKQSMQKLNNSMKKVLIIGINPETIDFTNPELPKGINKEMVVKGTQATLDKLNSIGYKTELFLLDSGASDLDALTKQLKDMNYDGVVIGNGIRSQASNFILFEQIVNVVHSSAQGAKIIFNTLPTNTDEAVRRWL